MLSKKNKKTKGKPVPLGEFLGASASPCGSAVVLNKSSWAEESEDYEEDRYAQPERLVLPTAPRNARESDVDPERIPRDPPYTAYIANLPFEVDDEDIIRFFQDLKVKSIRLPREGGEGGRFKGFGYVEFETRNELIEALAKNDDVMNNRKIRVDIAEGEGGNQRRGFSDRGGRDEDRLDRSEGVSDWRAPPRDAPSRDAVVGLVIATEAASEIVIEEALATVTGAAALVIVIEVALVTATEVAALVIVIEVAALVIAIETAEAALVIAIETAEAASVIAIETEAAAS
ncbi:Eukaryotic translation initiation factor 4B-like 1, partial [Homarus americanus]